MVSDLRALVLPAHQRRTPCWRLWRARSRGRFPSSSTRRTAKRSRSARSTPA